jgi:alcohol dehydrogenase
MQVRAAILDAVGAKSPYSKSKPLSIDDVDLDPPGTGEVLIRIAAAGLCHSDLSIISGNRPFPTPIALGHEAAGVVEEVGPEVYDLARGDHVVMVFVPSCGRCLPCAEGRPALCQPGRAANGAGTLLSGHRRLKRARIPINHHCGISAFAEFATVSVRSLVKIDPDLPLDEAALFGCAVLTGVGAVVNCAKVSPGSTVAVVGLGGVGLCALLGALAAGAARVVAVDLLEDKLALARQLGATDAVNGGSPSAVEQIRSLTAGGVEYAIETAGSVKAMELAYKVTRRGGTTVTVGLPAPNLVFPVEHVNLTVEERTVKGSYLGSCVPARDVPRFIAMYRQGHLPIHRLMTDRVGLEDLNSGFDRLNEGKAVRQIMIPC